jgi:hypothetical protein
VAFGRYPQGGTRLGEDCLSHPQKGGCPACRPGLDAEEAEPGEKAIASKRPRLDRRVRSALRKTTKGKKYADEWIPPGWMIQEHDEW